ncbi:MAG TPA: hypothetical protein ENL04_03010 [Sulfuricurvum sp.]|nr:hypothetical protein [Sulfuricurvum sp.]
MITSKDTRNQGSSSSMPVYQHPFKGYDQSNHQRENSQQRLRKKYDVRYFNKTVTEQRQRCHDNYHKHHTHH